MDKSSISGIIGWMQIQTTKRFHHPIFKMPSVNSLPTMHADQLAEKCIPTMLLVGRKLVTANHENRMELRLKGKEIELPYNVADPLMGLSPKKTRIGKTQTGKHAL